MNSSRMHEIMALVQKYQILVYLSFNVFQLTLARGDAATQNLRQTLKSGSGCPYDTCF